MTDIQDLLLIGLESERDEFGYPLDWPKCPGCGLPALDGHVTCGNAGCNERNQ